MKITIISSTVFAVGKNNAPLPGYGGLEAVAWYSAKGLAEKGHEVTLIAPDESSCPGCQIIATGKIGQHDEKMAYEKYWKHLLTQDVIIDHSWAKYAYMLKAEGVLTAPVLGVMHAPVNTMYQSLPPVEKPSIVCISQDQANHFEALFSRPAKVCYNGIDLNAYRPITMQRTNRFLFLARFSTIKGPDLAIQACKETGSELDLIGDTSITNEPGYFLQCKAMMDGKQIKLIGPCSRGEAVWWFSRAYAFIHLNQRFREPFGLAPVEAMACGLPVCAWNYGAMRETVKDKVTGFLVSNMEEAKQAITNMRNLSSSDMKIVRQNCQDWAQQFSLSRTTDRYEELCKEAKDTGGW